VSVLTDIRHAFRLLRRTPSLTAIALLSIALSVGATAVVFTAIKSVLIQPLPYAHPWELVQVGTDFENVRQSESDWIFWNDAEELTRRTRTLDSVAVYGNSVFDLAGDPSFPPEALYGLQVSANLFSTLGVSPVLGRNITEDEDRPGGLKVVILSHGLWNRRFNADPNVVGRRVKMNGQDCTVIGVMPREFNFPLRRQAARTPYPYVEFWAPIQRDATNPPDGALGLVARLRPGVSLAQAQADLASISSALRREFPATNRARSHRIGLLRDRTVGRAEPALWLLLAAAAMFLLIGCANVSHLLMARGLARRHEITIRMALGARGRRIVRQLLTESCVLGVIGGALGFVLTIVAWRVLPAIVPVSIPRLSAARTDWVVLGFSLLVAVCNGILFGVLPALRAARARDAGSGRGIAVRGELGRRDRTRTSLVVAEVAVTVMLVVVGGQLLGSFVRLLQTDPGFDADRVLASVVLPARERYRTAEDRARVYRRFLDAVRSLPDVESAGTVNALPFSGENHGGFVAAKEEDILRPGGGNVAEVNVVGGDYLQTLGLKLLEGRWFQDQEMNVSSDVAIVDEVAAWRLWQQSSAVGKRICVHCTPERRNNWKRVVGVVSSARHASLAGPVDATIYLSGGAYEEAAFLVVRSERRAAELERAVRAAVASIDPDQPVLLAASMRSLVDDSIADRRFIVSLLGVTALLALLMSAAGIYGVTAYTTSRRTQEFGIRIALGATSRGVLALVFRQNLVGVSIGLVLGLALATAGLRSLRGFLVGLEDPQHAVNGVAAALVLLTAALACWLPARRATKIDPAAALRQD
jgi:putative ABC transport system permease protein